MKELAFVKSSLGVFSLQVGVAGLEFVGVLYVARATDAATFGTYALFAATVFFAALLTDMGFSEATRKRISERTASGDARDRYFAASLLIRLALFVGVLVALLALRGPITAYIGSDIVFPFLVAGIFLNVAVDTFSSVLAGKKLVGRSVLLLFTETLGRVLLWFFLIYLGYGLIGILVGFIVGQLLAIALALYLLPVAPGAPASTHYSSLYRFARYSWLASIKETSWVWTDTLILGLFVASALIGIYEVSWQISGVFFFVGSAVSSALLPNVSELWISGERERVERLVESSLVYAGIIAIPGFVGAIFVGEELLSYFGAEFTAGYTVLLVLIFARVIHSYEIILEKLVHALDRPVLMFKANVVFIVLAVVLNVVLIVSIGWRGAAVATSLAMLTKAVLVYVYSSRLLEITVPIREIAMQVVSAGLMGIAMLFSPFAVDTLVGLVLVIALGIVVYLVSLLALTKRIRRDVVGVLSPSD
ncbi:lipopolysaccharide biosynthesis protein [Natronorubrum halophilum]|uniref:lipopolysaccharide biosynthesis protein n=1 Tax=Natronorubrum halophilum TaxID=1702106 RepID=UPI000EF6FB7B|nr:polysaccharide biosynthesis C-terminal domain-containing protein [Natronorubrum halophilum]